MKKLQLERILMLSYNNEREIFYYDALSNKSYMHQADIEKITKTYKIFTKIPLKKIDTYLMENYDIKHDIEFSTDNNHRFPEPVRSSKISICSCD